VSAMPRMLVAASCSVCAQDRPLTAGRCEHCTVPAPPAPRWLIRFGTAAYYVSQAQTRDFILRLLPDAVVTDLRSLACPDCLGSCTDRCDIGAGTGWERAIADAGGPTVSQQRGVQS
jgi:hypothetical protein